MSMCMACGIDTAKESHCDLVRQLRQRVHDLEVLLQSEPREGFPLGACHSCRLIAVAQDAARDAEQKLLKLRK